MKDQNGTIRLQYSLYPPHHPNLHPSQVRQVLAIDLQQWSLVGIFYVNVCVQILLFFLEPNLRRENDKMWIELGRTRAGLCLVVR